MEHKGIKGKIQDFDTDAFVVVAENTSKPIEVTGETLGEVRNNFQKAIDTHIAECEAEKKPIMDNFRLADELKRKAESWVDRSFNFIHLDVYEKMADGMLFEYIRNPDPTADEAIEWYDDRDDDEKAEIEEERDGEDLDEFLLENYRDEIVSYRDEQGRENYPMWNTLFEFRWDASEEWLVKAEKAGFGVIERLEDFNPTLFVAGCGYSFYGTHWIPLYLSIFEAEAEYYKNVKYDMM